MILFVDETECEDYFIVAGLDENEVAEKIKKYYEE